jgi:TRAP-type C4-dicarboxylate transport system permease small subunit
LAFFLRSTIFNPINVIHNAMLLIRWFSRWFAVAGAAVALFVAGMTSYSVISRWLTSKPVQGDVELTQMGIALSISLCVPWCQMRNSNIIVDFFTQKFSPRKQDVLDGVGCMLLALMCSVLAWRTGIGALSVHQSNETSMILGLPMWWVYAALAPGLALTALICLIQAWLYFTNQPQSRLTGAMIESPAA